MSYYPFCIGILKEEKMGKKLLSWKAGTVNALLMGWGSCFQLWLKIQFYCYCHFPKRSLSGSSMEKGGNLVSMVSPKRTVELPLSRQPLSELKVSCHHCMVLKISKYSFLSQENFFFLLSYRTWNWISVSVLTGIWNSLSFQVSIYIPARWFFAIRVSNWINIEKC